MNVSMKFVNIMGPKEDLDRVIDQYVFNNEIQLENALSELKSVQGLAPCDKSNIYAETHKRMKTYRSFLPVTKVSNRRMPMEEALELEREITRVYAKLEEEKGHIEKKRAHFEALYQEMKPFSKLDVTIEELLKLEFIKFRFGKMPRDSYKIYEAFLKEKFEALFMVTMVDNEYAWGIYFEPGEVEEKLDTVFSSLHFERIFVSAEMNGTPSEIVSQAERKIKELKIKISQIFDQQKQLIMDKKDRVIAAYTTIDKAHQAYDIRKNVAIRKNEYYIIVGWMTEKAAMQLEKEISKDSQVTLVVEDPNASIASRQPVKLRNSKLVQPFESFVSMYSMPSHGEFDPTTFIAITYTMLFGAMFGDFGQGAVIFLLGLYLYLKKGIPLGGVAVCIGMSAMFFGFAYGSVFGFEDWIPTLWMKPMEQITTTLMIAVAVGIVLIITAMIFSILNAMKAKNYVMALCGPNSVASLLFYVGGISMLGLGLFKKVTFAPWIYFIVMGIPFLLIAMHSVIERVAENQKPYILGSKLQFAAETFFEMFEVVLGYVTNTISFVRVGAFALSHAGMMHVVHMLANSNDGITKILILIVGNMIVMGLEGLIVGIQVLRLEYYEMFGRFYKGGCKEFKPSVKLNKNLGGN